MMNAEGLRRTRLFPRSLSESTENIADRGLTGDIPKILLDIAHVIRTDELNLLEEAI